MFCDVLLELIAEWPLVREFNDGLWCQKLEMSLNEENARISLLGCLMSLYVFFGALVIRKFESPFEKRMLRNYWKIYGDFEDKLLNGTADMDELRSLLYTYGNLTAALGVPGHHERWNFLGSLHFVVTIVTTIGVYFSFLFASSGLVVSGRVL